MSEYNILLIADSQPRIFSGGDTGGQLAKWRQICADLANRHPGLDRGFFNGDLVDEGKLNAASTITDPYTFAEFKADIVTTGLPLWKWQIIPGNHDVDYAGNIQEGYNAEYWAHFYGPRLLSRDGNIVHISLGPDKPYVHNSWICDETVAWLRKVLSVLKGSGISVILHLHQPIRETTVGTHNQQPEGFWTQYNGGRLINLLNEPGCPVVMVVSGHSDYGMPAIRTIPGTSNMGLTAPDIVSHMQKYGPGNAIWHVNVGLHIPSYMNPSMNPGGIAKMSYCTAHAVDGSSDLVVKRWNVETGIEVTAKQFTVSLHSPFQKSHNAPEIDRALAALSADQFITFTPKVVIDGAPGTFSPVYNAAIGRCYRTGKNTAWVNIHLEFSVPAYSGASGFLSIRGIPLKTTIMSPMMMGMVNGLNLTTPNQVVAYLSFGRIVFRNMVDGGAATVIGPSEVPAGNYILTLSGTVELEGDID